MYPVDDNTTFIEEKGHRFFILTPYDRLDIVRNLKKAARDQLVADLEAAGIAGEQRYAELQAFQDRWDDEAEFIRYVNSVEADVDVAERALPAEQKPQAREIVSSLRLPLARILAFKAALTGLELVKAQASGSAADPQTPPATYGG